MSVKTGYQMLAEIKYTIGEPRELTLRPYEEVLKVTIGEDKATVLFKTRRVKERRDGTLVVTHEGKRLISWSKPGTDWIFEGEVKVESELEVQVFMPAFDSPSVEDRREKKIWEQICYRPGNNSRLGQRDGVMARDAWTIR